MPTKHHVRLTPDERTALLHRIASGTAPARTLTRARILLKADASTDGDAWTDRQIAEALDVAVTTVERIRKRCADEGALAAIEHKRPDRNYERALDGAAEAHLVQIACSQPPEGREAWSMRLLAARMVTLGHVEALSYETVRRVLKKTRSSPGALNNG